MAGMGGPMQDPSSGIAVPLLPYVHLISVQGYPRLPALNDDAAVEYLLQAPRIVRDMSPMVWQMIQPPQDGSVFLTWQAPRMGKNMPSDGYIWADAEQTHHFEFRGFQIEMLIHRSGFRPGTEQFACHQRKRFHIISKLPSQQQDIDPSLWIVHYGPADPNFRIPVQQIPLRPDQHTMMRDRQFLLSQGQLIRKEFMLHDRSNWPVIQVPGPMPGMQPPTPSNPAFGMGMMPQQVRHPQYYPQQQPPQQPVQQPTMQTPGPQAKKQRIQPPARMPTGMAPIPTPVELALEDEENTALGDFLDHVTPRELSTMRYKQHHEWMEEIFSSVYASSQIVPDDLGFGLAGDLEDLTRGILEEPIIWDATMVPPVHGQDRPGTAGGTSAADRAALAAPKPYKHLDSEKRAELNRRITAFTENGHAELRAMKTAHAKKLADFRKAKAYTVAERNLRASTIAAAQTGGLDSIVAALEKDLGVSIQKRRDITTIAKGGLDQAPPPEDEDLVARLINDYATRSAATLISTNVNGSANAVENQSQTSSNGIFNSHTEENGHHEADDPMHEDTAAGLLLDQYGNGSYANTPSGLSAFQGRSLPPSNAGTPGSFPPSTRPAEVGQTPDIAQAPMDQNQSDLLASEKDGADEAGLDLMEGMDLDVGMSDLPDGGPTLDDSTAIEAAVEASQPAGDEWVMVDKVGEDQPQVQAKTSMKGTTSDNLETAPPANETVEEQKDAATDVSANPLASGDPTDTLFDTSDLTGFDSAGDALADLGNDTIDVNASTGVDDDFGLNLGDDFEGAGDLGGDTFGVNISASAEVPAGAGDIEVTATGAAIGEDIPNAGDAAGSTEV